jgi:Zn-dependent peptidase ImmA (M78 family)
MIGTDEERVANEFAAELLMPETSMRGEIVQPVTLSRIAELKPRWKVAIQALVRRSFDLGIITERQYRYLFEQIGSKGWRTHEPGHVEPEKPRALRQMVESLYGQPIIDYQRLASDVRLRVDLVRDIIAAYAGPPNKLGPSGRDNVISIRAGRRS